MCNRYIIYFIFHRYLFGSQGRVTTEKQFGTYPVTFALQTTVKVSHCRVVEEKQLSIPVLCRTYQSKIKNVSDGFKRYGYTFREANLSKLICLLSFVRIFLVGTDKDMTSSFMQTFKDLCVLYSAILRVTKYIAMICLIFCKMQKFLSVEGSWFTIIAYAYALYLTHCGLNRILPYYI